MSNNPNLFSQLSVAVGDTLSNIVVMPAGSLILTGIQFSSSIENVVSITMLGEGTPNVNGYSAGTELLPLSDKAIAALIAPIVAAVDITESMFANRVVVEEFGDFMGRLMSYSVFQVKTNVAVTGSSFKCRLIYK